MAYTKAQIKDSVQRVVKFIEINKKAPLTVRVNKDTLKWAEWKKLAEIKDAETRLKNWIKTNKKYPNYVTTCDIKVDDSISKQIWNDVKLTTSSATTTNQTRFVSSPYLLSSSWVKQDYDTSCALNSIQESFYKLTKIKVAESTMYKLGYTGSSGTGHDGIKAIVNWLNKNYKTNISVEFKNLKDFGKTSKEQWTAIGKLMSKSNVAVFFHIYYRNGGLNCTSAITNQDHGHYEILDIINVGNGYVRALNSLSGGYLQDRKISVQECFMKKISQPSVIILTKK
ncbi:MAG: hypothetical protein MJ203_03300 [archaeon]|nr:hypothetical protein [archaeon]